MTATPRAEREFTKLSSDEVPRYLALLERIHRRDPSIQWVAFEPSPTQRAYGVEEMWEAKASRKHRLFTDGRNEAFRVLGFAQRGQKGGMQWSER